MCCKYDNTAIKLRALISARYETVHNNDTKMCVMSLHVHVYTFIAPLCGGLDSDLQAAM